MATIRKRTWTSRGRDQTAWVVDYFDQAGTCRLKTFATKKDADAWAVTALHEVKQGVHTPASTSVTVTEAWERWIKHCEGLEFGTLKQRRQHLKLHVAPFLGREKLSSLSTPRIHQFDADLRAAGRSLAMRRKVLTNIKTMLTFCQGQGLVAQNVSLGVRLKADERQSTGPLREGVDFPSKGEIKALIDNVPDRWRAFLLTAIFTGMRASELRGVRWTDIDLNEAVIHVRRRVDNWRNIGAPKSKAGKRDIPLTPMVVNALRQWQPACPAGQLGLVFPNGSGNVESHTNLVKRVWGPLQRRCGLTDDTGKPRYGFHALRHAAASLFIAHLGWTPKRVQSLLGHSSITMTFDRYGRLFEDRDGDRDILSQPSKLRVAGSNPARSPTNTRLNRNIELHLLPRKCSWEAHGKHTGKSRFRRPCFSASVI
jgi:integrase